jgi:hypothetical protein
MIATMKPKHGDLLRGCAGRLSKVFHHVARRITGMEDVHEDNIGSWFPNTVEAA